MARSSMILYNEADEKSENHPHLVNSFGHLCNIVFCVQQKQQQIQQDNELSLFCFRLILLS